MLPVVMDYCSSFFEVRRLEQLSSGAVINAIVEIFARYEVPVKLMMGNAMNFSSANLAAFLVAVDL